MNTIAKVAVARQLQNQIKRSWSLNSISYSRLSTSSLNNNSLKPKRKTELDFNELETLLQNENVSLIDVRHPRELQSCGEIPGSVNIPLNSLKNALQLPEKEWSLMFRNNKPAKFDRNIVFYARGPNSSSAAVEIAHKLGYVGSRHYKGGWEDYCSKAGIPVKKYELMEDYSSRRLQLKPADGNNRAFVAKGCHVATN